MPVNNIVFARTFACRFLSTAYFKALPEHMVVKLPNLSPTMDVGTVVSWAKKEGDQVCAGDLLAEIETDKATMSWDSVGEGYVANILCPAGTERVPVNSVSLAFTY